MRVEDVAMLAAHDVAQRESRARDENRIEISDIEPDDLGARVGDLVLEPAAVRRDEHAMVRGAQYAHEVHRAGVRRPRMQRRREHENGQRPRKRNDFANRLWCCDRNFGSRFRVERTARVCSRIQDRPHRPGAAVHPESASATDVIYRLRCSLDSPEKVRAQSGSLGCSHVPRRCEDEFGAKRRVNALARRRTLYPRPSNRFA
jgi:hypothetical protein